MSPAPALTLHSWAHWPAAEAKRNCLLLPALCPEVPTFIGEAEQLDTCVPTGQRALSPPLSRTPGSSVNRLPTYLELSDDPLYSKVLMRAKVPQQISHSLSMTSLAIGFNFPEFKINKQKFNTKKKKKKKT